jgi:pimeloyl-ACP methyl ester carboxylesterase
VPLFENLYTAREKKVFEHTSIYFGTSAWVLYIARQSLGGRIMARRRRSTPKRADRGRLDVGSSLLKQRLSPLGKAFALHRDLRHYPQGVMQWVGDRGWMPKSQVLLNSGPALDAIVFVHGWGGDARATWETFPQAVATMPEASFTDVFFLDYPSTTSQVPFCANQLRRFLFDVVRNPVSKIINGSLPRGAPKRNADDRYERVFIVGHSMGAVIARRALLDLDEPAPVVLSDEEFATLRLLFFAPAHSGSNVPLLIESGLGLNFLPGVATVGRCVKLYFQSLADLEHGSGTLKQLAEDCRLIRERRTLRKASIEHLRASVYHAHNDRVVSQNRFDLDAPFDPVMQKNHRSICKPCRGYLTPVEALSALLVQ